MPSAVSQPRVMVIGHQPGDRAEVKELLALSGFVVLGEGGYGMEAVSLAKSTEPDVVVISIEEPLIRALQTVEALVDLLPTTPIIGYSSIDELSSIRKAMLTGVKDYLVTPLKEGALIDSIHRVLAEEKRPRARLAGKGGRQMEDAWIPDSDHQRVRDDLETAPMGGRVLRRRPLSANPTGAGWRNRVLRALGRRRNEAPNNPIEADPPEPNMSLPIPDEVPTDTKDAALPKSLMGPPRNDALHFSVAAPHAVEPGSHFVVDVWAHLASQSDLVARWSQEALQTVIKSKGPVRVQRDGDLRVTLDIPGFAVDEPDDVIHWMGQPANATFSVLVPDETLPGNAAGLVCIYLNGLRIVRIDFAVSVRREPTLLESGIHHRAAHSKAFASYAHADRDEVLSRVQGMLKIAPQMDVFLDVFSLRSGEDWQNRLRDIIPRNDVFYLFWSLDAMRSEWVEREWRCALETRGLGFIDPVPLVSPELVPPPPELAAKHFNDWTLAFRRASGAAEKHERE